MKKILLDEIFASSTMNYSDAFRKARVFFNACEVNKFVGKLSDFDFIVNVRMS